METIVPLALTATINTVGCASGAVGADPYSWQPSRNAAAMSASDTFVKCVFIASSLVQRCWDARGCLLPRLPNVATLLFSLYPPAASCYVAQGGTGLILAFVNSLLGIRRQS